MNDTLKGGNKYEIKKKNLQKTAKKKTVTKTKTQKKVKIQLKDLSPVVLQSRLKQTLKNTDNVVEFPLHIYNISYVNTVHPLPELPSDLIYVTEGTYNTIYKTPDEEKAYRISTNPISIQSQDAHDLINECLLTYRLSKLGISPKMYDCFFVKNRRSKGENTHCVLVTEYSKHGSLSKFLASTSCTQDMIPHLVHQTATLYQMMVQAHVFCTDVKPQNMLVTETKKVYLIDFDDQFCASKESKYYNGTFILKNAEKITKKIEPYLSQDSVTQRVTKGFWQLNLLQVNHMYETKQRQFSKVCTYSCDKIHQTK